MAIRNILVTHEGVDADAVYQMVKAMFGNMDALVAAHAAAKGIKLESAASGLPLPFASGCRALLQGSRRTQVRMDRRPARRGPADLAFSVARMTASQCRQGRAGDALPTPWKS